ncbi:hypothetical protein FJZ26_06240, partial [Candidatus Parvarchaeota archaeon]|nr:hypothetical protein [Candidatus Parvarchaeota archaeon]
PPRIMMLSFDLSLNPADPLPLPGPDAVSQDPVAVETVRTYGRVPFRLQLHLERLFASGALLGFCPPFSSVELHTAALHLIAISPGEALKLRLMISAQHVWITAEPLLEKPELLYRQGVGVVSFRGQRFLPEAKWLGDPVCLAAKAFAESQGVYEALLVGPADQVPEAAYANFFWVKEGHLFTPAFNLLAGVTRQTVLELRPDCRFETPSLDILKKADELFLTQTTSGILPVTRIDDQPIFSGQVGPVTHAMMRAFSAQIGVSSSV